MSAARELLSDVHLTLGAGEVAVVAGARGAGKSLLAALAAGDRVADRGRVRLLGEETGRSGPKPEARRRIGWCSDGPVLLPDLSAADNVALPLRIAGAAGARDDAVELLTWLGSRDPQQRGRDLPPEEAMRVGVARALIGRPALAVLDEPLRAGDATLAERLVTLVEELGRGGSAFLIVAEDLQLAERLRTPLRFALAGGRLERA